MEYSLTPQPKNKKASLLSLSLAAGGMLSLIGPMAGAGYDSLFQSVFVICEAAAILLFVRYVSSHKTYTLTDAYGSAVLIVTERQGRRVSTLYRAELAGLIRIVPVFDTKSAEGQKAFAAYRQARCRYSYLCTLDPSSCLYLFGREGGTDFAVRLEWDEAFFRVLSEETERAARSRAEEENDE